MVDFTSNKTYFLGNHIVSRSLLVTLRLVSSAVALQPRRWTWTVTRHIMATELLITPHRPTPRGVHVNQRNFKTFFLTLIEVIDFMQMMLPPTSRCRLLEILVLSNTQWCLVFGV